MIKIVFLFTLIVTTSAKGADWQNPVNLGSVINSGSNDWYPVVAQDGSFMIFVSERPGGYGQSDLWISRRINNEWQPPKNMGSNVNTSAIDSAPYLAENDSVLYFTSSAPGGYGQLDVYRAPLVDGIPGMKENLGPEINGSAYDCCPVLSSDGNTLFICSNRAGGFGNMDVWVSEKINNIWSTPVNMGNNFNSNSTDCPRWISETGDTLIVCSTRSGGLGNADLYYTIMEGSEWSPLTNFGAPVNSSAMELGPGFINNEGQLAGTILFGSNRSGGYGGRDIWQCTEIRKESIIDLGGKKQSDGQAIPKVD
jgi:Tol biopolymer transport system component